jgi:predicted MFS family arabinose efflux permease
MGVQESIVRAAVADLVPSKRRAGAYGVFDTGFGIFWFLGSSLMGILYDRSIPALVAFSVAAQLAALPLLVVVASKKNRVGL